MVIHSKVFSLRRHRIGQVSTSPSPLKLCRLKSKLLILRVLKVHGRISAGVQYNALMPFFFSRAVPRAADCCRKRKN